MFGFESLEVYQLAKTQNLEVLKFLYRAKQLDLFIKDQWRRASMSIVLNLVEGTARTTNADKKHFYTMSRGSVYGCAAILETVHGLGFIDAENFKHQYNNYEQISKMLLALFRSLK